MTRRISLVAVCCSSASVSSRLRASSSVNRRTFSIAMTAWSAKVWSSVDLAIGEGRDLGPPDRRSTPMARPRGATERRGSCGIRSRRRARWTRGTRSPPPARQRRGRPADPAPRGLPRTADRDGEALLARVAIGIARDGRRDGAISVPTVDGRVERLAEPRRALARSASNTGWTSVGDLEMTRRISPVAVCCSSVSVRSRLRASSSLKSRTFSIAITAWSAKVFSSAICRRRETASRAARRSRSPRWGLRSRSIGTATSPEGRRPAATAARHTRGRPATSSNVDGGARRSPARGAAGVRPRGIGCCCTASLASA